MSEISEIFNYQSPFGDKSLFASKRPSELWDGYVDFFKGLERFGSGTLQSIPLEGGVPLDEVVLQGKVIKTKFDYRNIIDPNKGHQSHWELGKTAYLGRIVVNKKIDYLSDRKLFFSHDGSSEIPPYGAAFSIYKPYHTDNDAGTLTNPNIAHLKKNAALQIQGLSFMGCL